MRHSAWHGFTAYDGIFPLFIFLSGVTLGLAGQSLQGRPWAERKAAYQGALRRLGLLLLLGILYNHGWGTGLPAHWDQVRFASVLGRIGLAWFFAALISWHWGWRVQLAVSAALLLGYWAILGGHWDDPASTPNAWVDQQLLPGIHYHQMPADPEGLLSTLPAIVNALLGALAGRWLKRAPGEGAKVGGLVLGGLLALALGYGWSAWLPLNKTLWTSSFVLVTSGWSALLLALFYALVDLLGMKRLGSFFAVIGANAICIYLASSLFDWPHLVSSIAGQWIAALPAGAQPLAAALGLLAVQWLVLAWFYRRRIFIKV